MHTRWRTNLLLIPKRGYGFVVMTNVDGGEARKKVMQAIRRTM